MIELEGYETVPATPYGCDDCMYCQGRPKGTGKNPQAKSNQRGDYK